jgi:hypothetical protein
VSKAGDNWIASYKGSRGKQFRLGNFADERAGEGQAGAMDGGRRTDGPYSSYLFLQRPWPWTAP